MELFQKLRLPPVRYFMLGCHYIWNVILWQTGQKQSESKVWPRSGTGVGAYEESSLFWLWSTADQKNSEAAPLRCAMAACCHPSNSPSTAPALTFWPNSESKNCSGTSRNWLLPIWNADLSYLEAHLSWKVRHFPLQLCLSQFPPPVHRCCLPQRGAFLASS